MKNLIIVGAGGLGREVLQTCMDINKSEHRWNIKGFIDDNLQVLDGLVCKYSVIGTIRDWQPAPNEVFVLAIASPKVKKLVVENLLARGAEFETVISPRAFVADNAKIGKAGYISHGVIIGPNTIIGDGVLINTYTGIGHDVEIGNYTSIMSYVDITGHTRVGKSTYWGSGSHVYPGKIIGDNATVGMGSVVIRNVRAGITVFGNPAKDINK